MLGKKNHLLVFTRVHVCVKAKLTLVIFFIFFAPSPYAIDIMIDIIIITITRSFDEVCPYLHW